jgi:hypothetical protein
VLEPSLWPAMAVSWLRPMSGTSGIFGASLSFDMSSSGGKEDPKGSICFEWMVSLSRVNRGLCTGLGRSVGFLLWVDWTPPISLGSGGCSFEFRSVEISGSVFGCGAPGGGGCLFEFKSVEVSRSVFGCGAPGGSGGCLFEFRSVKGSGTIFGCGAPDGIDCGAREPFRESALGRGDACEENVGSIMVNSDAKKSQKDLLKRGNKKNNKNTPIPLRSGQ